MGTHQRTISRIASQISIVHLHKNMAAFPPHFHNCYVLGVVAEGSSCILADGERYALSAGSVLAINPGQVHSCAVSGSMDYYSVHIPVTVMRNLSQMAGCHGELPYFRPQTFDSESCKYLAKFLRQICARDTDIGYLADFMRRLRPETVSAHPYMHDQDAVRKATEIILCEYAKPLLLDELAMRCAVSTSTLRRSFVRRHGMTPHAYLISVRIENARMLLNEGCGPAETAQRTGFCDQSHMTNAFQKYIGVTPGLYAESAGGCGEGNA